MNEDSVEAVLEISDLNQSETRILRFQTDFTIIVNGEIIW